MCRGIVEERETEMTARKNALWRLIAVAYEPHARACCAHSPPAVYFFSSGFGVAAARTRERLGTNGCFSASFVLCHTAEGSLKPEQLHVHKSVLFECFFANHLRLDHGARALLHTLICMSCCWCWTYCGVLIFCCFCVQRFVAGKVWCCVCSFAALFCR